MADVDRAGLARLLDLDLVGEHFHPLGLGRARPLVLDLFDQRVQLRVREQRLLAAERGLESVGQGEPVFAGARSQ